MMDRRLADYGQAWAALDTAGIASFWAPDEFRFYKAEEIDHFFVTWRATLDYWQANDRLHAEVALKFSEIEEVRLTDELHFALAAMEWRIRFRDDACDADGAPFRHRGKTMAGFNHVLTLWNLEDSTGKLTGWCEAPDAASLYVTKLYTRLADLNR